jgi:hypothetical protein
MIDEVSIDIGGQSIDKHYGDWLNIWNELTQTAEQEAGYAQMVGGVDTTLTTDVTGPADMPATTLYVPLQFWFCRNPGLALPLIALQYHEVKFNLSFRPASQCYITDDTALAVPEISNASLYVDYIYLDTDERRRMAQVSHEYLIEQLQFPGSVVTQDTVVRPKLIFNHPCKEFIWTAQPTANVASDVSGGPQWFNFSDDVDMSLVMDGLVDGVLGAGWPTGAFNGLGSTSFGSGRNPELTDKLQLNGHERMAERDGRYFNLVQPYQHHENIPSPGINVYSFALKPEEHQPSGTLNCSRIDNATLQVTFNASAAPKQRNLNVYAVNYNVLRIMSGMGGLAYAN